MSSAILILAATLYPSIWSSAITPARDGRAEPKIVTVADPPQAERTAAWELAAYLEKATGAKFTVVAEDAASGPGPFIHVGPTKLVFRALAPADLEPEQWIIRTVNDDLLLAGGRPRGTLYAVYHFLEDVVGVHWWNPWEESVPRKPTLSIESLTLQGRPAFRYRDIYMLYGHDGGRFAARNRLNRQGDEGIAPEYGGSRNYGPPYHVHTFYTYVPPDKHFKQHPEWFSLLGGKRVTEQGQLCLTNQSLREFFLQKLRAYIYDSREAARRVGTPPPEVFSASQNDWAGPCQCDACQAIARSEESEAGPIIDFVNYLADAVREQYPDVMIDTLAYWYSDKPPKTIRPRDNVIIRLCDTGSNFINPSLSPKTSRSATTCSAGRPSRRTCGSGIMP
jgi:hypothetical protein